MWIYVGLGGIIGSLLRYVVTVLTVNFTYYHFPLSTFIVNVIGSFLLGFLSSYFLEKEFRQRKMYTAITTGVIGSFTTFSAFTNEIVRFICDANYTIGMIYLFLSILLGLSFSYLGMSMGRKWSKNEIVKNRQE
ncbi:CrcB family protein [Caldifermentibacillus hisashii]|uniref:fluoride efflux transporter FluC n=1 Tax=Caldifermentibacillus hisashii TaxID=996558 RepID=UPI0034D4140D